MPIFPEARSRRAWRREVAARLVEQVDARGSVRLVGTSMETRREMFKVASLLPPDILAEIYEDRRYPGRTFMELSLMYTDGDSIRGVQVVFPDQAAG
jgi:hypothetical protein